MSWTFWEKEIGIKRGEAWEGEGWGGVGEGREVFVSDWESFACLIWGLIWTGKGTI